jgi:hydroxyethylthiazole kinase-like uncharacterized protein yjeF
VTRPLSEITKLAKTGKSVKRESSRASKVSEGRPVRITRALLRDWPLPQPSDASDKEDRGRVLVVGGETETPGAVILAATAALRAGAGKLRIATCRSLASHVAVSVLEARVVALPETRNQAIAASGKEEIIRCSKDTRAVLIGPGLIDERAAARIARVMIARVKGATLILDAAALSFFKNSGRRPQSLSGKIILTPNADEMCEMLGISEASLKRDPCAAARRVASELGVCLVMKGNETFIAAPQTKKVYSNRAGNVGLATSGSGDVLSGIIAGLAARGAPPLQAAVWGVYLHARAGDELAKRTGRLGYLARELLQEVPALMSLLGGKRN